MKETNKQTERDKETQKLDIEIHNDQNKEEKMIMI